MRPQQTDHRRFRSKSLLCGEVMEFRSAQFRIVAEGFLELFELMEDYAPAWYSERHHKRALAVRRMLPQSATRRPKQ